jgi:hypothetical protein
MEKELYEVVASKHELPQTSGFYWTELGSMWYDNSDGWKKSYNSKKQFFPRNWQKVISTPKEEVKELPGEIQKLDEWILEKLITDYCKRCSITRGSKYAFHYEQGLRHGLSPQMRNAVNIPALSPDPSNTIEIDGEVTATLRNPYENDTCNYVSYGDYCDPDNCSCKKSYQWKKENQPFSMWIHFDAIKPRIGVEVLAFSKKFIHSDYNPKGIRIGFLNEDDNGPFISAYYNNSQDCYKTCEDIEPELWSYITNFEPSKLNVSTKEKDSKGEEGREAVEFTNLDNMQYYHEYCQRHGYITPKDWLTNHKHF